MRAGTQQRHRQEPSNGLQGACSSGGPEVVGGVAAWPPGPAGAGSQQVMRASASELPDTQPQDIAMLIDARGARSSATAVIHAAKRRFRCIVLAAGCERMI